METFFYFNSFFHFIFNFFSFHFSLFLSFSFIFFFFYIKGGLLPYQCANTGGFYDANYCYISRPVGFTLNWNDAQVDCGVSGSLPSIYTPSQNAFVRSNIYPKQTIWLYGNDAASVGTYVWGNGSTFSYTNWLVDLK